MNLTDLADIFTVGSPNIVTKKLQISARMEKPCRRYSSSTYRRVWRALITCWCGACQESSFFQATIRLSKRFFTGGTIDDGLSFDGIESYRR